MEVWEVNRAHTLYLFPVTLCVPLRKVEEKFISFPTHHSSSHFLVFLPPVLLFQECSAGLLHLSHSRSLYLSLYSAASPHIDKHRHTPFVCTLLYKTLISLCQIFLTAVFCCGAVSKMSPPSFHGRGHERYSHASNTALLAVCIGSKSSSLHRR